MDELLQTKLYKPRLRPSLVVRPRLLERLDQALMGKVTLVSAPAGYGKTTLVAQWAATKEQARRPASVCWLALESRDDNLLQFWRYVVAALQTVHPPVGQSLLQSLRSPQPPAVESLLTPFINELAALKERLIVIIDDLHHVTSRQVFDALAYLIERQPSTLHLILLTREDPLLPLARLRGAGQVGEIRMADLRFSAEEAAAFLNEAMSLGLSAADVQVLHHRTEGWIVGLQMAAISMRDRSDPEAFVQAFGASNRYVLDYLLEEVFQQQPQEIQAFLLKTAILRRLHGPLCDTVLGGADGRTAELLERLEKGNLFVMSLDQSRQWFRYHHLFAQLLRHRLRHQTEWSAATLHGRASRWYEVHGYLADAIEHAQAAEDWDRAAALIEGASDAALRRGDVSILAAWLESLPREHIESRPILRFAYGWVLMLTRRLDEAETYLTQAEADFEEIPLLLGQVLVARANLARARHDVPAVIAHSERALRLLSNKDDDARSVLSMNLGIARLYQDDLDGAEAILLEAAEAGQRSRHHQAHLLALSFRAQLTAARGQLHQAAEQYRRIIAAGRRVGAAAVAARARVGLAALLYEWNELEVAAAQLEEAVHASRLLGDDEVRAGAYRVLAYVHQAQGASAEAQQMIEKACRLTNEQVLHPNAVLANQAAALEIALVQGDLAQARRWAATLYERAPTSYAERLDLLALSGPLCPHIDLAVLRLALAEGRAVETELRARRAAASRRGLGYCQTAAEVLLARLVGGRGRERLVGLLRRAEQEQYTRVFVDAGPELAGLVRDCLTNDAVAPMARRLLTAWGQLEPDAAHDLLDPLSSRELEVLPLLAMGKSNAEIAAELIVSVNTVKTHLRHIYEKLGVNDRRAAVARAKALALL